MCGMGGYYTNNPNNTDLLALRNLILVNTLRGEDAFGMFDLVPESKPSVRYWKRDMHPLNFVVEELGGVFNGRWKSNKPILVAAHCRAATQGKLSNKNAHPFVHGNTIGMHNGTVPKDFENRGKFGTDSEAIIFNIEIMGIKEALNCMKDCDPAYALVYYNLKEHTLNLIRNSKRPLHICEALGGFYWSSEQGHLETAVSSAFFKSRVYNARMLSAHSLYTLDLNAKDPKLEITPLDIKEPAKTYYADYGYGYAYDSQINYSGVSWLESCGKTEAELTGWSPSAKEAYPVFDKKSKKYYTDIVYDKLVLARKKEEEEEKKKKEEKKADKGGGENTVVPFPIETEDATKDLIYSVGAYGTKRVSLSALKERLKRGCGCCGNEAAIGDPIFWLTDEEYMCLDCTEEIHFDKTHWIRTTNIVPEQTIELISDQYKNYLAKEYKVN